MAIEEPSYQVLTEADGYEVRRYPPYVVAELRVAGASFEQAGNEAFRPLADFVFGDNTEAEEIGMTAPVTQRSGDGPGERIGMTAPVTQRSAGDGSYVIQFVMPSRYTLETVPRPNDPRIRLRREPEQVVAVLRYSGWWSEARYRDRLDRLRAALERDGLAVTGDPVWARFNSPFQLWFLRRNEIWLPVDRESGQGAP
jgi:hypothetical protein